MISSFRKTTWRLIVTPPAQGAWNMAVDEAILETSGSGQAPPALRLYAWEPACLSLGFTQPNADADRRELARLGWQLVRRPTGGRAILHTDEITYSVTGPSDEPRLAGSVLESYRVLSAALLAALHRLNIPAQAIPKPRVTPGGNTKGPVCFEVPSNYEITVDGKKLVGSAQARRREGVLQHGSLPLKGDLRRITRVLVFADESRRTGAAERLLQRAVTAEELLGYPLSWETAADAIIAAFQTELGLDFQLTGLTEAEQARADQLVVEKFNAPTWTDRL